MTPAQPYPPSDHWRRVEDLFVRALDLPAEERSVFLDASCTESPLLREEVASLLKALDQAGGFLEGIDPGRAAVLLASADTAETEQIGPYRIVREIGRGGMGVVYLAERAAREEKAQFHQVVALLQSWGDRTILLHQNK
jgi:eukaryotic-like serine/threonine-protein kinase